MSNSTNETTPNIPEPNDGGIQPPRPPNRFILYRRQKLREGAAGIKPTRANASRLIGELWKQESKEVKDYYAKLAEEEEKKHKATYPGYVYRPGQRGNSNGQRKRQVEAGSSRPAKKARSTQGHIGDDTGVSNQWDTLQDLVPSPPLSAAASPKASTSFLPASKTTPPATKVTRSYPGPSRSTENLGPSPPLSAVSSPGTASSSLPTVLKSTSFPSWELATSRRDLNALRFDIPSGSPDGGPLFNSTRASLLRQPQHDHNLDCVLGEIIPGLSDFQDHASNFEISAGEMPRGGLLLGGFDDALTQYPDGEPSSAVDEPLLFRGEDYLHFGEYQTSHPGADVSTIFLPAPNTTPPAAQVARPCGGAWGPPPLSYPGTASSSLPIVPQSISWPSWELGTLRGDVNALQFDIPNGSADGGSLCNTTCASLPQQPHEHNLDCVLGEGLPGLTNFHDQPSNLEVSTGDMPYSNGGPSSYVNEPPLLEAEDYSHFGDYQTRYPDANVADIYEPLASMAGIPSDGTGYTFEDWIRDMQELNPHFGTPESTVPASA